MKKIKSLTLFFITGFSFGVTSCSRIYCCDVPVDNSVILNYVSQDGAKLINSSDSITDSTIKIYFKRDDQFFYVNDRNSGIQNAHEVYEEEGKLLLRVIPSYHYKNNQSITLIELTPSIVDTLVCQFEVKDDQHVCKQAWLNGVEMPNRYLEVIK